MKHLDLFSGIGGFSLAARWAEIETIQFVEKDPFCQKVLKKHWPNVPIHDDIKTFECTKHVELITGGFPCQPFSLAGKKKGFADDRYLWPDMFRIIKQCRPTWVIAENVSGIIPHLDSILEDLERENYTWWAYLIPASAVGAPHKRERLWIIAYRDSERCDIGVNNREERHIQIDWQRHVQAIQSEWPQFFPQSWTTFNAQDWLTADTYCEQRDKMAEDKQSISQRCERENTAAEIGKIISDSNTEPSAQKHTDIPAIQKTRAGCDGTSGKIRTVFDWEENKPPVPGMDDGLPHRLDRNKALGNAIVPQIAYIFMRLIKEVGGYNG